MAVATSELKPATGRFKRTLGKLDTVLFTVCAILVIDQLAASATIGPSALFWWLFTLLVFFIPYGLICAELGTTYPEEGGIYAWVRRAFGPRWGARASWLYWINVALWMPSVYVLFAGMFAQLFMPQMSLLAKISLAVVMTWATVYTNVIALNVGKWIPNVGAVIKAVIMVAIGVGGFFYASRHGVANEFSVASIAPTWGAGLAFLPVIVYSFMGFELMSGASEEMENPSRDVPRAIVTAGVLISVFYLLGTLGILIALPVDQIGLIDGLLDTVERLFADFAWGKAMVVVIGIGALYSFVANMTTWTIGANRSAAEAADRGDLPRLLGRLHPQHGTPVSAAILTGIVSTAVIIVYGLLASTAEDLFWTLFAFSSIVFLLPYFLLFGAFVRLRTMDASRARPYKVPGGHGAALILAGICALFILQAIVFFIYTPGGTDWKNATSIVIGVIVTIVIGELLMARASSTRARTE